MNTEMMTIRQAAQTLRVREEEMPALLGQSGMQTEAVSYTHLTLPTNSRV